MECCSVFLPKHLSVNPIGKSAKTFIGNGFSIKIISVNVSVNVSVKSHNDCFGKILINANNSYVWLPREVKN